MPDIFLGSLLPAWRKKIKLLYDILLLWLFLNVGFIIIQVWRGQQIRQLVLKIQFVTQCSQEEEEWPTLEGYTEEHQGQWGEGRSKGKAGGFMGRQGKIR